VSALVLADFEHHPHARCDELENLRIDVVDLSTQLAELLLEVDVDFHWGP